MKPRFAFSFLRKTLSYFSQHKYSAGTQHQSIAYRLVKLSLFTVIVLGILESSIQLYTDLQAEEKHLDHRIEQIINIATPTATMAVNFLDEKIADTVVNGLMSYEFITSTIILDENDVPLAQANRPLESSVSLWVVRNISDLKLSYSRPLAIPTGSSEIPKAGKIILTVDKGKALGNFLERSIVLIATGLLRNIILALFLSGIFFAFLTKPLLKLANEVRAIDHKHPAKRRVTALKHHTKDELDLLIIHINHLLGSVDRTMHQQAESEQGIREIVGAVRVCIGARDTGGRYLFANQALLEVLEANHDNISDEKYQSSFPRQRSHLTKINDTLHNGSKHKAEVSIDETILLPNGRTAYYQTHIQSFRSRGQDICLVVSNDITTREEAKNVIEHMAYHDSLTGLSNREHLLKNLKIHIDDAKTNAHKGVILFMDLDRFKHINDSLGHHIGDMLLKHVSMLIVDEMDESALIARISGDEFVCVQSLGKATNKQVHSAALKIAHKLSSALRKPFFFEEKVVHISGTVGVALYPNGDCSADDLIRQADMAMYQGKQLGRNRVELFDTALADRLSLRMKLESGLYSALEKNEFEMYYQPKYNMMTGKLTGAEALVRWRHTEFGYMLPDTFIPILEDSALLYQFGQATLDIVCRDLAQWQTVGLLPNDSDFRIGVNISPRQFRYDRFTDDLLRLIKKYSISPTKLELEITETCLIDNVEATVYILEILSRSGFQFTLDDFGTGYSSISYLKRLPVYGIKIDKSFIAPLPDDEEGVILIDALISLARALNLKVTAEGVENEQQLALLQSRNCDYYQGFLKSEALKKQGFEQLLGLVEA